MSFLALVVFLLFACELNAATYWVSTSSTTSTCNVASGLTDPAEYLTLSNGVACMSASGGDTLILKNGTYSGITYNSITMVSGIPTAYNTIRAETAGSVTFSKSGQPFNLYSGNKAYIEFIGLIFDGTNDGGVDGIALSAVDSAQHLIFTSCTVRNWGHSGILAGTYVTFRNGFLHDNGHTVLGQGLHGWYLAGNNSVLENSEIYNNGDYAIQVYNNTPTSNNIIRNNYVHDNGFMRGANGGAWSGIFIGGNGSDNIAYNNVIANEPYYAIQTNSSTRPLIYNNTLYNNGYCGVGFENTTNGTVRNNIFYNNGLGGFCDNGGNSGTTQNTNSNNATNPNFASTSAGNANYLKLSASTPLTIRDAGVALGSPYNVDKAGVSRPRGTAWDMGAYEYQVEPPAEPRLVLALPLDTGSGDVITDISGFGNNGLFGAGVSWDNSGKYGKALSFDGTAAAVIPHSASLDLLSMTIEAWVYPTSQFSVFKAIAVKNYTYYLYAYAEPGTCPVQQAALAGFGGAVSSFVCDVNILPVNTWSHLAVTFDGTTLGYYRNGSLVSTSLPGQLMVSGNGTLQIGGSQYGEYFQGKIDEVRIYNYARTQVQIQSDMNTPLVAAPGAVAGITFSADRSITLCASCSIKVQAQ